MLYMPADLLGWRPAAQSWLDRYLSNAAAAVSAAAADADQQTDAAAAAAEQSTLSAQASHLESPASPQLPGFGKAGFDSFNAARVSTQAAGSVDAGAGGSEDTQCCPDSMSALRGFIWGMFERFTEPLLQWVADTGVCAMQVSAAALMTSVTTLLEIQLDTLVR